MLSGTKKRELYIKKENRQSKKAELVVVLAPPVDIFDQFLEGEKGAEGKEG